MKGGGYTNYIVDEEKRLARQAVLDGRVELTPERLLEQLDADWVARVMEYQASLAIDNLVSRPTIKPEREVRPEKGKELTPEEVDKNTRAKADAENVRIVTNNTEIYDDDVEELIEQDLVIATLYRHRANYANDESFSEALRVRRTIVAYGIYTAIVEFIGASETAA